MKYCPRCKQKAADGDAVCARCGGPLRMLGGPAPAATARESSPPEQDDLRLTLAGLQHEVERTQRSNRRLAIAAAALLVLFVLLVGWLRYRYVHQFATIERIDFAPSRASAGSVEIVFEPSSGGKVEFVRASAERQETLVEHIDPADVAAGERRFVWSGSPESRFEVSARFREGWGISSRDWASDGRSP